MDSEDSLFEFIKDVLTGGCIFKMDDEIPKGYSLIKRFHRYVKAFVGVGILCE